MSKSARVLKKFSDISEEYSDALGNYDGNLADLNKSDPEGYLLGVKKRLKEILKHPAAPIAVERVQISRGGNSATFVFHKDITRLDEKAIKGLSTLGEGYLVVFSNKQFGWTHFI